MAGHEGSGSPTPSEQENHDDKNENNNMQDEEQGTRENDDAQTGETMNDMQESQINDVKANDSSTQENIATEASVAGENNVVVPNPDDETYGAQALENEDAEMAQPAQAGSGSDIMMEDPNAGPDLEEELGGVIIGEISYANGLVDLLVISIDSSTGTPEV